MQFRRHLTLYLKNQAPDCVWFLSIFLVSATLCSTAWSQPDAARLSDVAEQLARYFPKVTGEVIKVERDNIYVGVGARDGILPGIQLTLFRQQQTAPETGAQQTVNRVEEAIGYLIVEEVFERYALAGLLATPGREARRGDKVRITAGPISVGVLPIVDKTSRASLPGGLTAALQAALADNERFHVVSANRILLWSLEHDAPLENGLSPNVLLQMANSLRFGYAAVGTVKEVGGESILEVALLSPQVQRLVASGSVFLTSP